MGIPSAQNLDILGNQDFVWGVALMLSGIFVAAAVIKYGLSKIVEELSADSENDWPFPKWSLPVISYEVPTLGITIFSWWMWLSATAYAPNDWYDPTSLYSVATCVVQWGVALLILFIINRWMNNRLENPLN